MNKFRLALFALIFVSRFLCAEVYLVDDFADGDFDANPQWWSFGNIYLSVEENNKDEFAYLGDHSLRMKGESPGWYIGGVGRLLGIDTKPYNAIKLLIRGYGPKSGNLVLELYDDDNNNWAIELHPNDPSTPLKDDKFIYTLPVTWFGWKVVILELKDFVDDNKNFGDNIFNPYITDNSGGLLQMQLLLLSSKKDSWAKVDIDSIKFFYYKKPKVVKKVEDSFF